MKSEIEIESFIRNEINKLDILTGISTINSPIFFTNSYNLVGTYSPHTNPDSFSFSKRFFSDESIDNNILLYIIRHEYAHCMCFRLYGECGHGTQFKKCCQKLNCKPDRKIHQLLHSKTKNYILNDIINSEFHSNEFHQ